MACHNQLVPIEDNCTQWRSEERGGQNLRGCRRFFSPLGSCVQSNSRRELGPRTLSENSEVDQKSHEALAQILEVEHHSKAAWNRGSPCETDAVHWWWYCQVDWALSRAVPPGRSPLWLELLEKQAKVCSKLERRGRHPCVRMNKKRLEDVRSASTGHDRQQKRAVVKKEKCE